MQASLITIKITEAEGDGTELQRVNLAKNDDHLFNRPRSSLGALDPDRFASISLLIFPRCSNDIQTPFAFL